MKRVKRKEDHPGGGQLMLQANACFSHLSSLPLLPFPLHLLACDAATSQKRLTQIYYHFYWYQQCFLKESQMESEAHTSSSKKSTYVRKSYGKQQSVCIVHSPAEEELELSFQPAFPIPPKLICS
mmetsp:Transcript_10402/g.20177  ORF Transcript_10402/g.20177 Transcript_10402/m.20177 type:complete len:125 (+) Transcript_10402:143-517(+)